MQLDIGDSRGKVSSSIQIIYRFDSEKETKSLVLGIGADAIPDFDVSPEVCVFTSGRREKQLFHLIPINMLNLIIDHVVCTHPAFRALRSCPIRTPPRRRRLRSRLTLTVGPVSPLLKHRRCWSTRTVTTRPPRGTENCGPRFRKETLDRSYQMTGADLGELK